MSDLIERMVTKFLCWKLPEDFAPDAGIRFTPWRLPLCWPVGTNLFTAVQAKQMIEHMLAGEATDALEAAAAKVPELKMSIYSCGIMRDVSDPSGRTLAIVFDRKPTDCEMRITHEVLLEAWSK